jgi:hypothetical protein
MSTNAVAAAGITIQTFQDCVDEILNGADGYPGLLQIYGPGLNVAPNSADGNMVNIYAQGKVDVLEQLLMIATSFDPDQAAGVLLDQRCAINGVFRMPGTFTSQAVLVTVGQSVTLAGLDTNPTSPFTVADGTSNQYQLVTTYNFPTSGAVSLTFQASVLGPITSVPNSITVPVTLVAGVISVNNPTGPTSTGIVEETDSALRIRRSNSTSLPSKGWLQGMYAGLLNVTGVTSALALENQTSTTNSYNMPPHSIWLIVAGSPIPAAVGAAIYAKRNACVDWTNGGTGGAGTAHLTGTAVSSITVAAGGQNFSNTPAVLLTGGGGTGATAHATVAAGVITGFVIDAGGTGYTSAPTVHLNAATVEVPITQEDGTIFNVFYDTPTVINLYFHATLTAITGSLDKAFIAAAIQTEFGPGGPQAYGINQTAATASIIAFINEIAPNASVASEGVSSDNVTFTPLLAAPNVNCEFAMFSVTIS